MLSSILEDVKEGACRQSSARARGAGKYERKVVFKVNEGSKYKVEG